MVSKHEDWLLKCPVCSKKLWFSNIAQHRRFKHSELSTSDFEAQLIRKISSGELLPKYFADTNAANSFTSSTQAIRKKNSQAKSKRPFQGGRGGS